MKNQESLYVEQLKDGRFQYRLRFTDPKTGKTRRISTIKDTNSRQAYNQALRELQNRAVFASIRRETLDQALSLYLEDKRRILRPQTLLRNEAEIRLVNASLGSRYLDALNILDVKRALQMCSASPTTYNERLARYKAFLNWCFQNDLIQENLGAKLVKLPDNKKERISDKYLEPDELQKLLEALNLPMWYHLTLFLVLSGLRIGEAIALRMSDVGEKYINVDKTFSLITQEVGETKTDTSTRQVYIQPELRLAIDDYLIYRAENFKRTPFFFPGKDGWLQYNSYRMYLQKVSRKVLGRAITPHALRHTSASLLIAQGVQLETVSRRLGHADSKITKEIYVHLTDQVKRADENALASTRFLP